MIKFVEEKIGPMELEENEILYANRIKMTPDGQRILIPEDIDVDFFSNNETTEVEIGTYSRINGRNYFFSKISAEEYIKLLKLVKPMTVEKRTQEIDTLVVSIEGSSPVVLAEEPTMERLISLSSTQSFNVDIPGLPKSVINETGVYNQEVEKEINENFKNGKNFSATRGKILDVSKKVGKVEFYLIKAKAQNGNNLILPSPYGKQISSMLKDIEVMKKFEIQKQGHMPVQPPQPQPDKEPSIATPGVPGWLGGRRSRKEEYEDVFASDPLKEPKTPWYVSHRSEKEEPTPMTPEEAKIAKEKIKSDRRKRDITVAIIVGSLILTGVGIAVSRLVNVLAPKTEGETDPSFSPTATATFTPEPSPTASPVATATPTASPTATPNLNAGKEFLEQLKANGYKYILDGDIISFDEDEATEVLKYLSNKGMGLFHGLKDNITRELILNYQQAILLYCADTLDPTTSGPVYIGDSCNISDDEKELLRKVTDFARNIAELSVDQPLNGKIIDSNDQLGKFDDEYVAAVTALLMYQENGIENDPVYVEANLRYKYLVRSIITTAIKAYVPSYFSINDPENGDKKYVTSFKFTRSEDEKYDYIPMITENGVRFSCKYDLDPETKEPILFTFEEMMSYMDYTSANYVEEMSMVGIAKEAFDARNEIDNAIFAEAGISVEKDIPITK